MTLRRGSESNPSARSTYSSASARQPTSVRKCSSSRWWGSGEPTTPSLAVPATPSSWPSPNYTYLKLKMPVSKGVTTVGSSFEHAYECDIECVEHAEALTLNAALAAQL